MSPDTYSTFMLPTEAQKRDRNMTAYRMGQQEPDLGCGLLATVPGGVLSAYADNKAFPAVTGELHVWTPGHAEVMRFGSVISALRATPDLVVVGTEHGEAVALQRDDGTWRQLATVIHPVTVTSVAVAQDLACSASQDGLIVVWRVRDGSRVLITSLDAEPLHISLNGTHLSVVDTVGRKHLWHIDNLPIEQPAPPTPPTADEVHLRAAACLAHSVDVAEKGKVRRAIRLLDGLPDLPQRADIKTYWTGLLRHRHF
jgi:hypothetical protein